MLEELELCKLSYICYKRKMFIQGQLADPSFEVNFHLLRLQGQTSSLANKDSSHRALEPSLSGMRPHPEPDRSLLVETAILIRDAGLIYS